MKPFLLLILSTLTLLPFSLRAQNAATELAADRKYNEEHFAMINAKLASIEETQLQLRERYSALERRNEALKLQIEKLKEDAAQGSTRQVTREDLKKVVEQLQEVDRKREEDKKLILESIKDLAKLPPAHSSRSKPAPERTENTETVVYSVQKGNRLGDIIAAYNEEFSKQGLGRLTIEQVKRANPEINVDRIREGQTIKIPVPSKK